jgi:hypothetical protein
MEANDGTGARTAKSSQSAFGPYRTFMQPAAKAWFEHFQLAIPQAKEWLLSS